MTCSSGGCNFTTANWFPSLIRTVFTARPSHRANVWPSLPPAAGKTTQTQNTQHRAPFMLQSFLAEGRHTRCANLIRLQIISRVCKRFTVNAFLTPRLTPVPVDESVAQLRFPTFGLRDVSSPSESGRGKASGVGGGLTVTRPHIFVVCHLCCGQCQTLRILCPVWRGLATVRWKRPQVAFLSTVWTLKIQCLALFVSELKHGGTLDSAPCYS